MKPQDDQATVLLSHLTVNRWTKTGVESVTCILGGMQFGKEIISNSARQISMESVFLIAVD